MIRAERCTHPCKPTSLFRITQGTSDMHQPDVPEQCIHGFRTGWSRADSQPGLASTTVPKSHWRECRRMTMVHGRTFYFASQILPTTKKRAIHSTYAFCRVADDLVDREPELGKDLVMARLAAWEDQLEHPVDSIAIAYACTREHYDIPLQPNRDLFTGVRMDLTQNVFLTWEALREYCYCVAGTIGLITAPILGVRTGDALPHAVDLGIAMQLTNILRDVAEDAALGRLYLPLEDLAAFGVERESIFAGEPTGDFAGLMRFEIARARSLYESAGQGYAAIDFVGQFATLASGHLYGKILHQIEALDYDVFRERAHVSTLHKIREVPYILRSLTRVQRQSRRQAFRSSCAPPQDADV